MAAFFPPLCRHLIPLFLQILQLTQVAQPVPAAHHPPVAISVVDLVPDGQRLVQDLQCIFPLPQDVKGSAHIVQCEGNGLLNPQRAPNRQRLVEERQRFIFLAQVRVNPAHGVLGHCLSCMVVSILFNGQGFVQVIQRFLGLPCLPVQEAQDIQLRRLFFMACAIARRHQLLLMPGNLIL